VNVVLLVGNLTRDVELRFITQKNEANSVKAVATFGIAVNTYYGGEQNANFFNIVVWGKQGENCANYLAKGSSVCVQGELRSSSYIKDDEKRYKTEVVAEKVKFLGVKNKETSEEISDFLE